MLDQRPDLPPMDLPLTDRPETSFTLSKSYYTDPAIFEREKEQIFYRTWQYVAHKTAFRDPGDYVTVQICDQNVFVMKGGDGELRAFYNVCRHRAHELLSEPSGNVRSVIVCPYHAWTFEREGALRGARFSDQRPGFDRKDFGLRQVRLEEFCDCIFVNLDDQAQSLAEMAPDLEADMRTRVPYMDELETIGLRTDMLGDTHQKAGWKVVVDNYVECYHCNHAHPAFSDLICMDKYQLGGGRYWASQIGEHIRHENSAYKVDPDAENQAAGFWYLWPNTTFNILPGGKEMAVFAIRPISCTESSFEGHVLSAEGGLNKERSDYTADVLAPEDIALCESVQRGLMSRGYDQGPIIAGETPNGEGEHGIHLFHSLVHDALNGS